VSTCGPSLLPSVAPLAQLHSLLSLLFSPAAACPVHQPCPPPRLLNSPLPAGTPSAPRYVVLARPPGSMAIGRLLNTLRFRVKEIDPSTGV